MQVPEHPRLWLALAGVPVDTAGKLALSLNHKSVVYSIPCDSA